MKVIRNINNNVAVCVDDNNHEVIAFGKGIGFQKAPYEVPLDKIDQTYYNLDSHYIALLDELPAEIMEVTTEIVRKGRAYLQVDFNKSFFFTLCDHIHFAVENAKKGLVISNPMVNEIQHLYDKEILLGRWAIKHIEKTMSVKLPESEAGGIALHFINAMQSKKTTTEKDEIEYFVEDVTNIIESEMNLIVDRSDFSYSRFVTHLKYLLKRSKNLDKASSANVAMYEQVFQQYPELTHTIEKIKNYITDELEIEPSKEELLYLIIHINRLCAKEGL